MGLRAASMTRSARTAAARCWRSWYGQRSDHSLLGDLVELTAPGAIRDAVRQTRHAAAMLVPLLVLLLGFHPVLCGGAAGRVRAEILQRERATRWIGETLRA